MNKEQFIEKITKHMETQNYIIKRIEAFEKKVYDNESIEMHIMTVEGISRYYLSARFQKYGEDFTETYPIEIFTLSDKDFEMFCEKEVNRIKNDSKMQQHIPMDDNRLFKSVKEVDEAYYQIILRNRRGY